MSNIFVYYILYYNILYVYLNIYIIDKLFINFLIIVLIKRITIFITYVWKLFSIFSFTIRDKIIQNNSYIK